METTVTANVHLSTDAVITAAKRELDHSGRYGYVDVAGVVNVFITNERVARDLARAATQLADYLAAREARVAS